MKAEELALVQGWEDTRVTLRRWNAQPFAVLRSWALGSLAVAGILLAATWLVAVGSHADATGYEYPGVYASRDHRGLRVPALPQRARAGAALARLPGRLHGRLVAAADRGQLLRALAQDPREGGPAGDRLRRLRDALLAVHAGVRARPPVRRPRRGAAHARRCCSCSRSRPTPSRSCSRSSSRSPRGRSPATAARGTSCWPPRSSPPRSRSRIVVLAAAIETYLSPHLLLSLAGS